jgi:hypothetical protein
MGMPFPVPKHQIDPPSSTKVDGSWILARSPSARTAPANAAQHAAPSKIFGIHPMPTTKRNFPGLGKPKRPGFILLALPMDSCFGACHDDTLNFRRRLFVRMHRRRNR